MSDYKYHIGNKFGACRHIANAHDPHRDREVKLYHIPGNFEYVGMCDGTDAFVCPVNIDPFSAGIARLFADIRAGKEIVVGSLPARRPRVRVRPQMELQLDHPPDARLRVAVQAPSQRKERNRV